MTEAGFDGVGTIAWNGLFAPAATPKPVLEALFQAVNKAMAEPSAVAAFKKQHINIATSKSLDDARAWLAAEMKHWQMITSTVKIEASN
jgi:tripartite-type tricarboxylate transporter receptor subunit TctC